MKTPDWMKPFLPATKQDINKILMNQAEELAALKTLTTQLGKASDEIQAKLKALQDAIDAGTVTPEVEAAVAELTTAAQKLDDIVPDAPNPGPVPPTP